MLHLQELTKLFKEKGEALLKELEFQEHEKRDYVKSNEQGFTMGLFKHFGPEKKNPLVSEVDEDPVATFTRLSPVFVLVFTSLKVGCYRFHSGFSANASRLL